MSYAIQTAWQELKRYNQPMDNDNSRTLQSYQHKTQEYVEGTPPIDDTIRSWLDGALELLQKKGFKTHSLDLLHDGVPGGYGMVLADAVLLHFTPDECLAVARKVHKVSKGLEAIIRASYQQPPYEVPHE